MSPSPDPIRRRMPCSLRTNAPASSADLTLAIGIDRVAHRMCGSVTISMRPVPARFRSTSVSPATVIDLAVSYHQLGDVSGAHLLDLQLVDADGELALDALVPRRKVNAAFPC